MSKGKKKRQYYTGEQKVSILKRHLVEREDVSKICDELKLHPTVFYDWQRRFFENGVKAFESQENREEEVLRTKVSALESKLQRKDAVLSELMEAFSDDSDSASEDNEPPFLNNHLPVFPHIPTARSLR